MHVNQQIKHAPLTGTFRQRLHLRPPLPAPSGSDLLPLSSAALTLRHIKTVIRHTLVACAAFGAPCNILITTNIYCILMWSRAMLHPPPLLLLLHLQLPLPLRGIPYPGIAYFYYPDSPDKTATATKVRRQFAHKHRNDTKYSGKNIQKQQNTRATTTKKTRQTR